MQSDTQQQADKLIDEYTSLQRAQDAIDERMITLKEEIVQFTERNNMNDIKSGNIILRVYKKIKTVFPKQNEFGRKQIEEIMRNSKSEWKHAISFDITKLSRAYDKKQLSESLRTKLQPFTKQEKISRVVMQHVDGVSSPSDYRR